MSFLRQVKSGPAKGYIERDIIDAIIRAIQAGSRLWGYLEGRDGLMLAVVHSIIGYSTGRRARRNYTKSYVI